MTGRPEVLFWVQHLLGVGHLRRAAVLARAFRRAGMEVTLVSGGMPEPGIDLDGGTLVQLPPVRAGDRYFKTLVDSGGTVIDESFRQRRLALLLDAWRAAAPDIIITELFPFGRRQLRSEVLALLDAAGARRPRPLIVSSVRDILVEPPKPERSEEMLDWTRRFYDRVLVHGDPDLIAFDETFSLAAGIADRVAYTGYVVEMPTRRPGGPGTGEVVVSAGGGAVSEELFRAALAARPHTCLGGHVWRLLAGHALADDTLAELAAIAGDGVVVERARTDFTSLLANCTLSISQGGYNTVMELAAARARAVIVPYAGGLETEQTLRARLLETRTAIRSVSENGLGPETLAAAVDAAMEGPEPELPDIRMDGAGTSARLLREWLS